MDPYELFEFDAELAETGVWFTFAGGRLRIARRDNPRYREALRALVKGKERLIRLGSLPASEMHEMRRLMCTHDSTHRCRLRWQRFWLTPTHMQSFSSTTKRCLMRMLSVSLCWIGSSRYAPGRNKKSIFDSSLSKRVRLMREAGRSAGQRLEWSCVAS